MKVSPEWPACYAFAKFTRQEADIPVGRIEWNTAGSQNRGRVIAVGGGVAGLYCADKLVSKGFSVKILEARDAWGGRIETKTLKGPADEFKAEFGPMRFEPEISPYFNKLCEDLRIHLDDFPAARAAAPIEYPVLPDERERTPGNRPLQPLELLKLGVYRMLGKEPTVKEGTSKVVLDNEDEFLAQLGDDAPGHSSSTSFGRA